MPLYLDLSETGWPWIGQFIPDIEYYEKNFLQK